MDKKIKTIVPETQQDIRTRVEREGDELRVKITACTALDDELRSEFKEEIQALETEDVSVNALTDYSNQGNELSQTVKLRFDVENQLRAIDVVDGVVELGTRYYEKQLERELGREDSDETGATRRSNQQLYFDDDAVKEFCLLYRGTVGH